MMTALKATPTLSCPLIVPIATTVMMAIFWNRPNVSSKAANFAPVMPPCASAATATSLLRSHRCTRPGRSPMPTAASALRTFASAIRMDACSAADAASMVPRVTAIWMIMTTTLRTRKTVASTPTHTYMR